MNLTIQRTDIIIPERMRKDYGDVEDLADSINRVGPIQPIVLNKERFEAVVGHGVSEYVDKYTLIAGGRRLTAYGLLELNELEWGKHFVFKDDLPLVQQLEMELDENAKRLDMTWQERCLAIERIHELKVRVHAMDGASWGHHETGALMNMGKANVGYALKIAEQLRLGNAKVNKATGLRDAINVLLQQKEDEALKSAAEGFQKKSSMIDHTSPEQRKDIASEYVDGPSRLVSNMLDQIEQQNGTVETSHKLINLTGRLYHGSCLDFLDLQAPNSLNCHVISDPPYAIEMDHIQQDGGGMDVSRTASEHNVEDNLKLLKDFIPLCYDKLAPDRYVVLWCDAMHFTALHEISTKAGFKVQRWPLHWIKTHRCQNMAAQFNFTKATEIAIVMRKDSAVLARSMGTNYWLGDNVDIKTKFPNHPFVKPHGLWKWIMEAVALQGQTIFDPFAGVGSSLYTAAQNGYDFMGCELNELHYNECLINLADYYNKLYDYKVKIV